MVFVERKYRIPEQSDARSGPSDVTGSVIRHRFVSHHTLDYAGVQPRRAAKPQIVGMDFPVSLFRFETCLVPID
jgi:hypothetical protein